MEASLSAFPPGSWSLRWPGLSGWTEHSRGLACLPGSLGNSWRGVLEGFGTVSLLAGCRGGFFMEF